MERYDYLSNMVQDVKAYIFDNGIDVTEEGLEEELNDRLFIEDSVTGNASGSYTFNAWQAEENLCHNWDLLEQACNEYGIDSSVIEKGAEYCDVFRCYLLPQAIAQVLLREE